jgi:hypothetical protein
MSLALSRRAAFPIAVAHLHSGSGLQTLCIRLNLPRGISRRAAATCSVVVAPAALPGSRRHNQSRQSFIPETGRGEGAIRPAPRAGRHRDGFLLARRGFRRCLWNPESPGPHTAAPLPCRASAGRTLPLLLAAHSQCFEFCSAAPRRSRASPRALETPSQVSRGLRPDGHVARSALASDPPRMSEGSLRHSRRAIARAFSPSRTQKLSGTPRVWALRNSAPSPSGLTGKRLWIRAFRG